ncbi:AMP-dependent synthetase/ligase [Lipingzhangella sp. LS1_29]|uniref:Acyl-CoA synthetase n=1 Tax=Lipingzhangella rawalii TaxID=2055835 RepID=A0ABU2H6U7_9ACTN|nr:AMP-dependent synthetase/ligase [Lipingzhangella rawalii]MDS1271031.1 AMP-dependent synthetase/ligase [Lipingzhangella rawalii]
MGVQQDLRRARKRVDLTGRVSVEVHHDEYGHVREARTSALVERPSAGSVADIPFTNAAEAPEAVVLRRRTARGWQDVTAAEFARQVSELARGLVAVGLPPGGRVAIMSRTRYEWTLLDFAVWAAGGQSVPIYPTASPEQVAWILRDSGTRLCVVENAEHARVVAAGVHADTEHPRVWQIDDAGLEEISGQGRTVPESVVEERRRALGPRDIATIGYTSGTTGNPKGCVLTHANLHAESANLVRLLHPVFVEVTKQTASTLLFLPLAHILGRTLQLACMQGRIVVGHCPSINPDELRPELASFKPTFLVGVPYLFERIHDTARATAERLGRGASFARADRIAVGIGRAGLDWYLGRGPKPGIGLRLAAGLYDLLVYRRVRKALGGRVRYAISGGSPLDERLNLFFFGCGIVIYEGYGLTETTAAATVVPPLNPRPGTVGQPVPGAAIRIDEDGEVLVGGDIVFSAYWNNPEATREVLGETWFATGDLGTLDEDGFLTITGRMKDVLVTSGGKNVSPSVLEDRLRSRPPIGQCMVVGEGRRYVAALVTLEPDALEHWLAVRKRPTDTPISQLQDDPELRADIQQAVDYANEAVSRAEAIREFRIVDGQFTEDNGMLTPTLKVRRDVVGARHAADIEWLYS